MSLNRIFVAVGVGLLMLVVPHALLADEAAKPKPRRWDQEKAVARVKAVLELEESGDFKWDDIPWMDDVAKAVALANEERKPIFLYFSLKGKTGPAAAPC